MPVFHRRYVLMETFTMFIAKCTTVIREKVQMRAHVDIRLRHATGIDGSSFPLCNNTAFKLSFEASIKSLHSSGLYSILSEFINPFISWQNTRSLFIAKNRVKSLWRSRHTSIFTFSC